MKTVFAPGNWLVDNNVPIPMDDAAREFAATPPDASVDYVMYPLSEASDQDRNQMALGKILAMVKAL